jgi:hypothetical protein
VTIIVLINVPDTRSLLQRQSRGYTNPYLAILAESKQTTLEFEDDSALYFSMLIGNIKEQLEVADNMPPELHHPLVKIELNAMKKIITPAPREMMNIRARYHAIQELFNLIDSAGFMLSDELTMRIKGLQPKYSEFELIYAKITEIQTQMIHKWTDQIRKEFGGLSQEIVASHFKINQRPLHTASLITLENDKLAFTKKLLSKIYSE